MSQTATARRLSLAARHALPGFALLILPLLAPHPANAQMSNPGGHWVVRDSKGNPITPNYSDGAFPLYGTETISASESYTGLLGYALQHGPDYDDAYSPNELSPNPNPFYSSAGSTVPAGGLSISAIAANADHFYGGSQGSLGPYNAPIPVNGGVSVSGTITVTETWTWVPSPAPNGTPAPPFLDLLVSAPVSVGISPNYGNSGLSSGLMGTGSASNGLGDTVSLTTANTPSGPSLPGKHLFRFPVNPSTGQITVTVTGQASLSLTDRIPYGAFFPTIPQPYPTAPFQYEATNGLTYLMSSAGFSASARQDYRAVTISADVDSTFKKSPRLDVNGINYLYDQWGNIQYHPTINLRDSDGTMHGDVGLAAQPEHVLIPTPSDSALYITYQANRSGGWHIGGSQDWWYSSLTGVSANDMLTYPTDISTFVISYTRPDDPHVIAYTAIDNDPIYSQPLPGQTGADHVHLTYQDAAPCNGGDAAVATANYYMNVHDREENPFKFRPDEPFWKNVTLNTPIPKAHFLLDPSVTVTGQADGATTSGDMIGSAEWTLAFNAMPGWLQGVLKVAGVDDYSLKPTPVTGTVPFDGVWHSPIDVGATWDGTNLKPADTEEPFYEMTPRVQQYYVHTWTRTDHYVPPGDGSGYTGFAGQQDQQFDVRSTAPGQIGVRGTGDFSRISKP